MKIAIYGGTFNPPHKGHESVIKLVSEAVHPDRFFVIPAFIPPHKAIAPNSPSAEERLELCRLAFGNFPGVEVLDIELARGDTSYSFTTLSSLKEIYPDDEFYMVIGTDQLLYFRTWYRFADILKMVSLVVVSREEGDMPELQAEAGSLREEFGAKIILLGNKPLVISSDEIRRDFSAEQFSVCAEDFLNPNVLKYIKNKKQYFRTTET